MTGVMFKSLSGQVPSYYRQKREAEEKVGHELTNEQFETEFLNIGGGVFVERHRN